jgi:glyoxylase-like metal-dependent hydrolase (beta-lactamase superfamily II)
MQVEMLNVGWLTAPAGFWRKNDPNPRESMRVPVPAYLIETETERILVDTGLHPNPKDQYSDRPALELFKFEQAESIADQVDVSTISRIIVTHLHFDHAGGLALFPESTPIVVQRTEWEAGHRDAAIARNFFVPKDYAGTDREVRLVDGDHDLLGDGSIELLLTPGHTPGHQSVRVGDIVIGGDVVHFATGLDDRIFPALGDDSEAQNNSASRLRELRDAGLRILPGHDASVLSPGPLA